MLHYELTKSYIDFVSSLPLKERGLVLWNSQSILSTASGYLKMKIADVDEERSIFRVAESTYLFVQLNYSFVRLLNGMQSNANPSFVETNDDVIVSQTIKDLVSKGDTILPKDELEAFLEKNYFTSWFIKLFTFLPNEYRKALSDKPDTHLEPPTSKPEVANPAPEITDASIKQNKENSNFVVRKPVVKQASLPLPSFENDDAPKKKRYFHHEVDGAEYEKAILLELQNAYEKRISRKTASNKSVEPQTLHHVRFAPKEIVIAYDDEGTCLDLLLRKTTQNGCRLSSDDWLILLANTVDNSFAQEIEDRYPEHVMYTDNPNKGKLRFAIIVKKKQKIEEEDSHAIKKVKSKVASFESSIPSGAYENVDEEVDNDWKTKPHSSAIRLVKSKVANFSPSLPVQNSCQQEELDFDIDEEGFWIDENDFSDLEEEQDREQIDSENRPYPEHWHCYLCGKKKLYSGDPAQTIRLKNGNTAYLCKKHRGKL